jgi:hypothetical protein
MLNWHLWGEQNVGHSQLRNNGYHRIEISVNAVVLNDTSSLKGAINRPPAKNKVQKLTTV